MERTPSPRIVSVAANSSVGATESSGAEELATAEKYLNRGHGGANDNREAAQWLWKAVGKGNLAATMVLSDLYLRGDGIPKSCDQARLLLDVAARKGKTSAGERLRNLQAFGCQ
jgi:TPR repeat protein